MFGNLINNSLIRELIKQNFLSITPIDDKQLQVAQYPLRPLTIWEVTGENEGNRMHDFSDKKDKFILKPRTYYWIDVLELIKLPYGVVGRFIPSSNLIEKGLSLTAGKIEKPYGDKGEKIRFGVFNFLDAPVSLKFDERIAYIQFMDMRGLDIHEYTPTEYDKEIYSMRILRIQDDGAKYE